MRTRGHLEGAGWCCVLVCAAGLLTATSADGQGQAQLVVEDPPELQLVQDAVLLDQLAVQQQQELDLSLAQPGFLLPLADEDVLEQTGKLAKHFAKKDWGQAFRELSELNSDQLQAMVPAGGKGLHVTVKEQLQRELLTLPPDGLRAFRLYFDGQAREQLEAVRSHPLPGSSDQLIKAQALVDRMLASSVGGEAVTLLGDLYFERGVFSQAARCWQLALDQGAASGQDALKLQCKRVIALHRSGEEKEARRLYRELKERYGPSSVQIAGQETNAIAMLASVVGNDGLDENQPAASDTDRAIALPQPGAEPAWHLTFLDLANRELMGQSRSSYYYRGPQDLDRLIPPLVHDDQRVYFHWLDAVFALDQKTGKILWNTGSDAVKKAAKTVNARLGHNSGDPRNYRIALTGDTLLVTSSPGFEAQNGVFSIDAYDKHTGQGMWSSLSHGDWPITVSTKPRGVTVLGEVLIKGPWAYVVVQPKQSAECYLRCFDPLTGQVGWTVALGSADPLTFKYTNVKRMPQPRLMMHEGMVFVLTNNGGLVAVDLAMGEIRWALRTAAPHGIGGTDKGHSHSTQLRTDIESMANKNGAGAVLLHKGTLYAKEHNARELLAVEASTGKVLWRDKNQSRDMKLVGVDDERLYLMGRSVMEYRLGQERGKGWKQAGAEHGGAILRGDELLVYASAKLTKLKTNNGKPTASFASPYLSGNGGHVYLLNDLVVCISESGVTAFPTPQ